MKIEIAKFAIAISVITAISCSPVKTRVNNHNHDTELEKFLSSQKYIDEGLSAVPSGYPASILLGNNHNNDPFQLSVDQALMHWNNLSFDQFLTFIPIGPDPPVEASPDSKESDDSFLELQEDDEYYSNYDDEGVEEEKENEENDDGDDDDDDDYNYKEEIRERKERKEIKEIQQEQEDQGKSLAIQMARKSNGMDKLQILEAFLRKEPVLKRVFEKQVPATALSEPLRYLYFHGIKNILQCLYVHCEGDREKFIQVHSDRFCPNQFRKAGDCLKRCHYDDDPDKDYTVKACSPKRQRCGGKDDCPLRVQYFKAIRKQRCGMRKLEMVEELLRREKSLMRVYTKQSPTSILTKSCQMFFHHGFRQILECLHNHCDGDKNEFLNRHGNRFYLTTFVGKCAKNCPYDC